MERDYYAVLGLLPSATADDIGSAYRRLAKLHHPDRNPKKPNTVHRMRDINVAYGSSPIQRGDESMTTDMFGTHSQCMQRRPPNQVPTILPVSARPSPQWGFAPRPMESVGGLSA